MEISYDEAKHQRNLAQRGLGFDRVYELDFATAIFTIDNRKDYGEVRWRGLSSLANRIHAFVFVETVHGIRIISFRKANIKEVKHYEEENAKRGI